MESLPQHPFIVHLPMALAVLMPLIAGGILVAWLSGHFRKRTWLIVCALQLMLLGSSLFAMRSGEHEEDRVERVVAEEHIEHHEEAAELFSWASGILLVISFLPFVCRNPGLAKSTATLTLTGTLVILGLGYQVGSSGGALVYKHGAASAYAGLDGKSPIGKPARSHVDHDDDDDHHHR